MIHSTILKAWFDYCTNVLPGEWTVAFAEEVSGADGVRPPKPYITLKIISGPRKLTVDDNLRNKESTDEFYLIGQRGYTTASIVLQSQVEQAIVAGQDDQVSPKVGP